ncbi:DUF3017 domain-containing protein, partial [Frankia sp. AgB32]|uniref:DUF3017 domain-containing protein n=1 Tax=Frankia sp. AgB32 TaxID=631119 RepID=UPI0020105FE8
GPTRGVARGRPSAGGGVRSWNTWTRPPAGPPRRGPPPAPPPPPPPPGATGDDDDRHRSAPRDSAVQGPPGSAAAAKERTGVVGTAAAGRPGLIGWLRREAVFAAVLVGVFAGFVLVSEDRWRRGLLTVGTMLILAGLARLALPARRAGLLVVRGRLFDTVLLLGLGAAIVGLTSAVPYLGP